jgi:hypothetical protein
LNPNPTDLVNNNAAVDAPDVSLAEALNRDCQCVSIDPQALRHELASVMADDGLYRSITEDRPHLFSSSAVFVSPAHAQRMTEIIEAVEGVIGLPAYREHVLRWAPAIAAFDPGTAGVFLGYDFHLGPHGPQLIEINTNAGGALLNTVLARAQRACCREMQDRLVGPVDLTAMEQAFFDMFQHEWSSVRGSEPLRSVAIVDDAPAGQYLYPEFILFQRLFTRYGVACVIAGASELTVRDGALHFHDRKIDLVYNRLTDFPLSDPAHAALRSAYMNRQVVLTPHPRAHALYADKRNLVALTDTRLLRAWGVPERMISRLHSGIPRTLNVEPANAESLWNERKRLFFKPATGYGSKAAYRGDKLTKRAWSEILQGQYVAQALVVPSERRLRVAEEDILLKLDLRNYVYAGRVQLLTSRLYRGQTTNFRTPGGGFAPVFVPKASDALRPTT